MQKSEVVQLLKMIQSEYPKHFESLTENTLDLKIQLWFTSLQEISLKDSVVILQKHICSENGMYCPTLHHFLKNHNILKNGNLKTSGEAWEEALNNIKAYGYYAQKEGLDALDEITRKAVKAIGYREMCISENVDLLRAHFNKYYDTFASRENEYNTMPKNLQLVQDLADKKDMNQIEKI
jgi:hypothetical protein